MRVLIAARNRAVAVEAGVIVPAEGRFDLVLEFPAADVRPGLINAHDHLHRNHYGRLGRPPYEHAREWAADIQAHDADRIAAGRRGARREALLAGAWKNLFAGVTTVVHHDPWEPEFEHGFPVRVPKLRTADSLAMTPELSGLQGGGPGCVHLAEGCGAEAAEEVHALADRGLLTRELIAVHGVGMDEDGLARFRASGAALVWCPSSNLFLLGRTAPEALLEPGVDVLLGSDSRLTGDGDLLDELRRARTHGGLDDDRLEAAVGAAAARRLGLPEPSLEPGEPADLMVLAAPLLEARAEDVRLVMVAGAPRVAAPELAPRLEAVAPGGEALRLGAVTRWINSMAVPGPAGRALQ